MAIMSTAGAVLPPVSYHPNVNLVAAIIRAWTDPDFRDQLLTYPGVVPAATGWKPAGTPTAAHYARVEAALEQMGVSLNKPVVLTVAQHAHGYMKGDDSEVVFVLPDPPPYVGGKYSPFTAGEAMRNTICGM
jgi:hypothetical protein